MLNNFKEEIKKETTNIKSEIRQRTSSYILAAFGLVAALAWNDAITNLINYLFPFEKNTVIIKFCYALIITFIVVFVSVY
jgi:hypothetical protein